MNVRTISAPQDPLSAMTRQLGERVTDARNLTDRLTAVLAHIDDLRGKLRDNGVEVQVDLGDVGNAACVARRQVESVKGERKFVMPRDAKGEAA